MKIETPNVENMTSPNSGKSVANQFILSNVRVNYNGKAYKGDMFKSYKSIIAFKSDCGLVLLDEKNGTTASQQANIAISF